MPIRQPTPPNAGARNHHHNRDENPTVAYEMAGTIRWLDLDKERIVIHVTEATGHAGAFLDHDATIDVSEARLAIEDVDGDGSRAVSDLLPGVEVRVKAQMPRDLGSRLGRLLRLSDPVVVRATNVRARER